MCHSFLLNVTCFPVTELSTRQINASQKASASPELKDVFLTKRVHCIALYDSDVFFLLIICFLVVCYNWQSNRTENCQLFGEEFIIVDIWHELRHPGTKDQSCRAYGAKQ